MKIQLATYRTSTVNRVVIALVILLIIAACASSRNSKEQAKKNWMTHWASSDYVEDSVIIGYKFRNGDGLGGGQYKFNPDGTFEYNWFCDICQGVYAFGNYTIQEESILLRDTLCYQTRPYFANPKDTILFEGKDEHYLHMYWFAGRLCLSTLTSDSLDIRDQEGDFYIGDIYRKVAN